MRKLKKKTPEIKQGAWDRNISKTISTTNLFHIWTTYLSYEKLHSEQNYIWQMKQKIALKSYLPFVYMYYAELKLNNIQFNKL